MNNYTPLQLTPMIGRLVMHQHMAGDDVYGPVRVIAIHSGSDAVVLSGDELTGRCYSVPTSVTLFQLVSPTTEPQP